MRDPKFTSVFDSNSLLCVLVFELVWFKSSMSIQLSKGTWPNVNHCCHNHMFRKISSPGNIGSGTSPSVFIFERIVILCFVSFLYIVKNFIQASQFFFVGRVHGEKKTGDQTFSWPWNMCFTELRTNLESWWWVIVKRFFFSLHGLMIYMCVIQVKLEIYNVSWFVCIHYEWMIFFFISTGTYLLVKTVNQE